MTLPPAPWRILAAALVLPTFLARAQSPLPPERVPLDSLAAFRPVAANWQVAGGLAGDPRHDKTLNAAPGAGVLVCNPTKAARTHLLTGWEHGDLELDLEFLMATGANSGVYLQGRYEVQLFDSWGVPAPKFSDCGGLYERWDDARGKRREGFEGVAPRANACRAPGLWQHLHIEFQAPRFDADGKKIRNARFRKVVLNDFLIHENVEVTGPTRSSAFDDEKPLGPLMIQGDHGSVAIRAITCKRFDAAAQVRVENLQYKFYAGTFKAVGDYDAAKPDRVGVPTKFAHTAVEKSGKFALVFNGTLIVPRAGDYAFNADTSSTVRFTMDGQVVLLPFEKSSEPGKISLQAGAHAFRLDYLHNVGARPKLDVMIEGPGLAEQSIMANDAPPPPSPAALARKAPIVVEPSANRVRVQRSFVPFEPKKRLYAINVGTPAGVHFAYDFETGAILRVWRGGFLDAIDMWRDRGEDQVAKPTGPALTFSAKPTVALIEYPLTGGWPDGPDALQASQGYTLEPDGLPVFHSTLASLTIRDRIAPLPEGRGLTRTLTIGGKTADWSSWVLLAEAETITPQPHGGGWVIGDREWYLDWPANPVHAPVIHQRGGRQLLVVRIAKTELDAPLTYNLVW